MSVLFVHKDISVAGNKFAICNDSPDDRRSRAAYSEQLQLHQILHHYVRLDGLPFYNWVIGWNINYTASAVTDLWLVVGFWDELVKLKIFNDLVFVEIFLVEFNLLLAMILWNFAERIVKCFVRWQIKYNPPSYSEWSSSSARMKWEDEFLSHSKFLSKRRNLWPLVRPNRKIENLVPWLLFHRNFKWCK